MCNSNCCFNVSETTFYSFDNLEYQLNGLMKPKTFLENIGLQNRSNRLGVWGYEILKVMKESVDSLLENKEHFTAPLSKRDKEPPALKKKGEKKEVELINVKDIIENENKGEY